MLTRETLTAISKFADCYAARSMALLFLTKTNQTEEMKLRGNERDPTLMNWESECLTKIEI